MEAGRCGVRKLLVGLAAAVLVVITAALIIVFVIPGEAYKDRLIAFVKQATGGELRIAGPVRLSLLPALTIRASDVSFGYAPGALAPQMAALKELRFELQLLPLFHRALVVDRLVLVEPVISLELDKTGHPNWVTSQAAPPSPVPKGEAEPAPTAGDWGISSLVLKRVRIIDGKIDYSDQRTGEAEQLSNVDLALTLRNGGPLVGQGSAVWHGERVTLALGLDQPRLLLDGSESQVDIKLTAPPTTFGFSGRVAGLPPAELAGTIDLQAKSARELAEWLGSPMTLTASGPGPLELHSMLTMSANVTSLSDLTLALDAVRATGSAAIHTAGVRPVVTGKLAVGNLDLDPYLSPASVPTVQPPAAPAARPDASLSAPSPATQAGPGTAPAGGSPLSFADVDLDLEIGSIAYERLRTGASTVGLQVRDGRITADIRQLALYQGRGHGRMTVDPTSPVPSFGLDLALAGVAIGPLAQATIDTDRFSGTGSFDIAVTARGASAQDLIRTLSGKGRLSLVNGRINGVDLLRLAESASKIWRDLIGTLDVAGALNLLAHGQIKGIDPLALAVDTAKAFVGDGNSTNFGTLTTNCTFTDGIMRSNDLRIETGIVPITGAGTVDLRTHAVDYRVILQLQGGVTVPIQVTGTLDNPNFRPDLAAMLAQTPAAAIAILKSTGGNVGRNLGGVGQGLKNVGEGAFGAIKGLFGK
jgi:AsmA protein